MLEKLKLVEARYLEMAERAAQPDFYNDPKAASQLLKEQRQLEPIITAYRSYRRTQAEQEDLRAMLSEGLEPEMKALCQEEFSARPERRQERHHGDPGRRRRRGKRPVRPQPVPDVHDVRRGKALDRDASQL